MNFLKSYKISGIITQGTAGIPNWVTNYAVYYSTDGTFFRPVKDSAGNPIIFNGNTDQYAPVTNVFAPVDAQYVQIRPLDFQGTLGLRFDVLGCESPVPTPPTTISTQSTPTAKPTFGTGTTPTPPTVHFGSTPTNLPPFLTPPGNFFSTFS